jgi:hypothetical protein
MTLAVIPGPSQRVRPKAGPMINSARSPESIIPSRGYGFRARAYGAPRNDQ